MSRLSATMGHVLLCVDKRVYRQKSTPPDVRVAIVRRSSSRASITLNAVIRLFSFERTFFSFFSMTRRIKIGFQLTLYLNFISLLLSFSLYLEIFCQLITSANVNPSVIHAILLFLQVEIKIVTLYNTTRNVQRNFIYALLVKLFDLGSTVSLEQEWCKSALEI